jgi:hypothetical protein
MDYHKLRAWSQDPAAAIAEEQAENEADAHHLDLPATGQSVNLSPSEIVLALIFGAEIAGMLLDKNSPSSEREAKTKRIEQQFQQEQRRVTQQLGCQILYGSASLHPFLKRSPAAG